MDMSLSISDIIAITGILILAVGLVKVIRSTTHPCKEDK